jgi:hypothetical protein
MNSFSAWVCTGLVGVAAASISLGAGCGIDVGVGSTSGTGGHAANTGGCSGSVTSGGMGGDGATGSVTTGFWSTVASASVTAGSGGQGALCGGEIGTVCAPGEFCDYPSNSCGFADGSGTCKPIPMACDTLYFPACGCDGKIYGNDCVANTAGHDVAPAGTCTAPAGMFACGQHFCNAATQFCERVISDVVGMPDDYVCPQLPAACSGTASCACITTDPCGQCMMVTGGGLMVTCPGG